MIVIPVKKNDCHSRENGNLLFIRENNNQPEDKERQDFSHR